MKKCCFIVPYFGKFPNYIDLFLKSCSYNEDFDWLIFTDDIKSLTNRPSNVAVYEMSFEELKQHVQSRFDFKISLEKPYKLCDYKPAYGYIFEDYIKQYAFWGHCDVDVIFGDLSNFITDDDYNTYDKMFCLGHLILYRNSYENNRLFMCSIDNSYWYKKSFSTSSITIFDETFGDHENINTIFEINKNNIRKEDLSLNFLTHKSNFVKVTYNPDKDDFDVDETESIYTWENGHVYRYTNMDSKVIKKEYMYIHLQERHMRYSNKIASLDKIQIMPNLFKGFYLNELNDASFKRIRKNQLFNMHFFEYHFKWKIRGLKRKINSTVNTLRLKREDKKSIR